MTIEEGNAIWNYCGVGIQYGSKIQCQYKYIATSLIPTAFYNASQAQPSAPSLIPFQTSGRTPSVAMLMLTRRNIECHQMTCREWANDIGPQWRMWMEVEDGDADEVQTLFVTGRLSHQHPNVVWEILKGIWWAIRDRLVDLMDAQETITDDSIHSQKWCRCLMTWFTKRRALVHNLL